LKLKYYKLMIELQTTNKDYLAICRSYRAIFNTPIVQANADQWKAALSHAVMYLVLAPYDAEVSDLLHRLKAEPKVADLPSSKYVPFLVFITVLS